MYTKPPWLESLSALIKIIRNNGEEARFVGGAVRDSILNREVNDIDLATTMHPSQVIDVLEKHNIKVIPTGLKHGTVTAIFKGQKIEITTLRSDVKCDGRHAQVKFTDQWQEDAKRRDFTFNALYFDLEGKIHDYFCGVDDLQNKRLKFIGDPEKRIQEDYLRILRAFRFHTDICENLINEKILEALQKYRKCINSLSGERIQVEMFKLLSHKGALQTLIIMQNYGILYEIINAKVDFDSINIERSKAIKNPITKLALTIKNTPDDKFQLSKWLFNRWKIKKTTYKTLQALVENNLLDDDKKNLLRFGVENTISMVQIEYSMDKITDAQFLERKNNILNTKIPIFPVLGRDIQKLGFKDKEIGDVLKRLYIRWEESNYKDSKDELLNHISSIQS